MASSALADGWDATVEPPVPVAAWREISAGTAASMNSWVAYSSSTFAPFGDLATDGFRVRLGSGYGRYHYTTALPAHGDCRYGNGRSTEIRGRTSFSDILAGYQLSAGQLTVKAYAGLASDSQDLSTRDLCNASQGLDYGAKAVVEGWLNITPTIWAALDGSWTAAHAGYAAKLRVGYRILDDLSIGLEESATGNVAGQQLNSGAFVRYEWSWGEASVTGGVSSDHADFRDVSRDRVWGAINMSFRY
jgi:Cellulose biosynthesis protein BcsS